MRDIETILANSRLAEIKWMGDKQFSAWLVHPYKPGQFCIVASWDSGWEHVSASTKVRTPTWQEMCLIKDIFWGGHECIVQYHPPETEYVNMHPYCLHLWKKIGSDFETPPKELVGWNI